MYYLILLSFTFSNYIPSFYNYIYLCNFKLVSTHCYVFVLFCFEMGVSLHSRGCSGTYYVEQIG